MRNSQNVLEKEIESRPTNVSGRVMVAKQVLEFTSFALPTSPGLKP